MNEPSPSRELQIPKQLDEQHSQLDTLDKAIESLSQRLIKILSPDQLKLEANKAATTPVLCEYAENITKKTTMIRNLRMKIESLESRLEG